MKAAHKKFSSLFFNQTWDLIDKPERDQDENERMIHMAHASMIHMAHASMCHWLERDDCTNQNLSIGTWQLSRVFAIIGETDNALKYAEICLAYSQKDGVEKVFLGYAYEALARACKAKREPLDVTKFLSKAKEIAAGLGEEDKAQLEKDLASI